LDGRSVVRAYPDFPKLIRLLAGIEAEIARSREQRAIRDEIYNSIQDDFDQIVLLYDGFKSSEAVMLDIADKKYASEKRLAKISEAIGRASAIAAVGAITLFLIGEFDGFLEPLASAIRHFLGAP